MSTCLLESRVSKYVSIRTVENQIGSAFFLVWPVQIKGSSRIRKIGMSHGVGRKVNVFFVIKYLNTLTRKECDMKENVH